MTTKWIDRMPAVLSISLIVMTGLLLSARAASLDAGGPAAPGIVFPAKSGPGEIRLAQGFYCRNDGTAEIHTGARNGDVIIANRFETDRPVALSAIIFYTSGAVAGDRAEVIVYEEMAEMGTGPDRMMEAWRQEVILEEGFQRMDAGGLEVNVAGRPGHVFYIGLANVGPESFSLGIDLTGPQAEASYLSRDGGKSFTPLSEVPVIAGNAMIRAVEGIALTPIGPGAAASRPSAGWKKPWRTGAVTSVNQRPPVEPVDCYGFKRDEPSTPSVRSRSFRRRLGKHRKGDRHEM